MEVMSKGGVKTVPEVQMDLGGAPSRGGMPPGLIWPSQLPSRTYLAYGLPLNEKLIRYFSLFLDVQKVPETTKYEKEGFSASSKLSMKGTL
jgi:hypothetical protein